MPTYDYRCEACNHEFEMYQSIKAPPLRICPRCQKKRVVRLIGTGGGVIFKGSGFYQTDYRSKEYKKAAEAETKSASGDTSSTSDSKAKKASGAAAKPASKKPGSSE